MVKNAYFQCFSIARFRRNLLIGKEGYQKQNALFPGLGCAVSVGGGGEVTGSRDTQQHIMICPGYAEIREGMNLENDRDLVKYFAKVIKQRQDDDNV
jgi:hypothetical protein